MATERELVALRDVQSLPLSALFVVQLLCPHLSCERQRNSYHSHFRKWIHVVLNRDTLVEVLRPVGGLRNLDLLKAFYLDFLCNEVSMLPRAAHAGCHLTESHHLLETVGYHADQAHAAVHDGLQLRGLWRLERESGTPTRGGDSPAVYHYTTNQLKFLSNGSISGVEPYRVLA